LKNGAITESCGWASKRLVSSNCVLLRTSPQPIALDAG
jgi:hypothetical protein